MDKSHKYYIDQKSKIQKSLYCMIQKQAKLICGDRYQDNDYLGDCSDEGTWTELLFFL